MDTGEFLRRVWPSVGHYCLVVPGGRGFKHLWFKEIDDAVAEALARDARGETVYHACVAFNEAGSRKSVNAAMARSLWMDLDVGDGPGKFESIGAAGQALKDFLTAHALPNPLVVASGGGLHTYWTFDADTPVSQLLPVAKQVKALAAAAGFAIDPTRTADMASILRPVGTHNHKYDPAREVRAVNDPAPLRFDAFALAVEDATRARGVVDKKNTAAKSKVNAEFDVPVTYAPSDPEQVAVQCAQVRVMRDTRGNMPEPQWYGALQVVHFCEGGDAKIHEWSQGHPDYSAKQTDAKINQIAGLGPTTCATLEARNPGGCAGCPHRGRITSPIQLGVVYEPAAVPPALELGGVSSGVFVGDTDGEADEAVGDPTFVPPPFPFKRTTAGVVFTNKDGIEQIVYPYDLYLHEVAFDEATNREISIVRHHLPQEGWLEFAFRSSDVADERAFERSMRDNHVKPHSAPLLCLYLRMYMEAVQKAKKMRRLFSSMGWKDDMSYFVLGELAYHRDGSVERVGLSPSIKSVASGFTTKGDLDPWVSATRVLDLPGMEAHALMFGAGPGAPLMKFTGFEGALFNGLGKSNSGKTSMARFFLSMYGDFDRLKLKQRDTDNAKIGRCGLFSSLPVYVDEVTNEDPKAVSDFIYEITQGRSKLRLRIDGTERETHPWNTLIVSSSNASLSDKLGVVKANADAERFRLFEFPVVRPSAFTDAMAESLYRSLSANYGHAGVKYIHYIVQHQEQIRAGLEAFIAELKVRSHGKGEERMWLASVGCAIYGLYLMDKLGLLQIDVRRVAKWAVAHLITLRQEVRDYQTDPLELLGQYLNENAAHRLTVRMIGAKKGEEEYVTERYPSGAVFMRYDITKQRLLVARDHFRGFVVDRQDNWNEVRKVLKDNKILIDTRRTTMGKGSTLNTGQTTCLEFDLSVSAMSSTHLKLVRTDAIDNSEVALGGAE